MKTYIGRTKDSDHTCVDDLLIKVKKCCHQYRNVMIRHHCSELGFKKNEAKFLHSACHKLAAK